MLMGGKNEFFIQEEINKINTILEKILKQQSVLKDISR
jgi:hypothetical protein